MTPCNGTGKQMEMSHPFNFQLLFFFSFFLSIFFSGLDFVGTSHICGIRWDCEHIEWDKIGGRSHSMQWGDGCWWFCLNFLIPLNRKRLIVNYLCVNLLKANDWSKWQWIYLPCDYLQHLLFCYNVLSWLKPFVVYFIWALDLRRRQVDISEMAVQSVCVCVCIAYD